MPTNIAPSAHPASAVKSAKRIALGANWWEHLSLNAYYASTKCSEYSSGIAAPVYLGTNLFSARRINGDNSGLSITLCHTEFWVRGYRNFRPAGRNCLDWKSLTCACSKVRTKVEWRVEALGNSKLYGDEGSDRWGPTHSFRATASNHLVMAAS